MYSYTYDAETGGLLLNTTPLVFSNEPRPVYYQELDILGFDKYWVYEKNDTYPFMWAEANNYYYRGKKVARTKGGAIFVAPTIEILEQPEPDGEKLRFVDIPAMVKKNKLIMEGLVQDTIKKIYKTYNDYRKKIDVFYVAFSGGKDSIVALDLVQRTLPHNEFLVLFGDTGMEFPDTYDTVNIIKEKCERDQIEFLISRSEFDTDFTWKIFGPPATVTRWCCSVHKTAPQIVALRKKLQKTNFTGLAFIGVRASESLSRNEYDYISLGEKHKGQYSCNPILEWNSAELFNYIYSAGLYLNEAYKKGNRRAGCLVCPRAAERNEYMCRVCYPQQTEKYIDIIKSMYSKTFSSPDKLDEFIRNGGWKARKNGRDLDVNMNYFEGAKNGKITLKIISPRQDWKIWIKTIGVLLNSQSPYKISFRGNQYEFVVEENKNIIEVAIDENLTRSDPLFIKLLKNVFRKAACCIGCHECEADCHNGCITMVDGRVEISDKCVHCAACHKVEKGCLIYKSLEMPKGGLTMTKTKSLNCYSHFAPRMEWIDQFFKYKKDFDNKHSLGSQMYSFFKRFLRDSLLIDETGYSETAKVVENLGIDNLSSWGIIFANLSYTPQINWYVKNIKFYEKYGKDYTLSLLVNDGAKESWVADIWSCFSRFSDLPLGEIGFGRGERQAGKFVATYRTPWSNPDPRVILYSLYKFAEGCGGYNQFSSVMEAHSVACIGHGRMKKDLFSEARKNRNILWSSKVETHPIINSADLYDEYVVVDDNTPIYQVRNYNDLSNNFDMRLENIAVPLYKRMFLDAPNAYSTVITLLRKSPFTVDDWAAGYLSKGEDIVVRLFMASSKNFKEHRKSTLCNSGAQVFYAALNLPRFIWVCELYKTDDYLNERNAFGEIVLDATSAPNRGHRSLILLHYPGVIAYRDMEQADMTFTEAVRLTGIENLAPYDKNLCKIS